MKSIKNIIISRTDSIGDVVLTLPMAKALKDAFPGVCIGFLGKPYTKAVIEACEYVDEFLDVNQFLETEITLCSQSPEAIIHVFPVAAITRRARQLRIPLRIGTTNRHYHWFACNELIKLSRRKSCLHEAQLNLKLLEAFDLKTDFSLAEIRNMYGLNRLQSLDNELAALIDKKKYSLILHSKSQGNGREWGLKNFIQLIHSLDKDRYQIFISGTEKERELLQPLFEAAGNRVINICGAMNLAQFISFINHCDGLVASGTGPLHIAAALGKQAFGIFPPVKPIHPERWAPVGTNAQFFVSDMKDESPDNVNTISVSPQLVKEAIEKSAALILV